MSSLLCVSASGLITFIWCINADKYVLVTLRHLLFEDDVAFALSVGQLSDLVGWLSLHQIRRLIGCIQTNRVTALVYKTRFLGAIRFYQVDTDQGVHIILRLAPRYMACFTAMLQIRECHNAIVYLRIPLLS